MGRGADFVQRCGPQMCQKCGDFNFDKREITADLTGRVAMVTGGRVKIGFAVALKLLRCGVHSRDGGVWEWGVACALSMCSESIFF
jgi:hypothetical protein